MHAARRLPPGASAHRPPTSRSAGRPPSDRGTYPSDCGTRSAIVGVPALEPRGPRTPDRRVRDPRPRAPGTNDGLPTRARNRSVASRHAAGTSPRRTRTTPPGTTTRTSSDDHRLHSGTRWKTWRTTAAPKHGPRERERRRVAAHERERRAAARLLHELREHRRGDVDAHHRHAGCRERQRDEAGPDADLQAAPSAPQLGARATRSSRATPPRTGRASGRSTRPPDRREPSRSRLRDLLVRIDERQCRHRRGADPAVRVERRAAFRHPGARPAPTRSRCSARVAATTRPPSRGRCRLPLRRWGRLRHERARDRSAHPPPSSGRRRCRCRRACGRRLPRRSAGARPSR